MSIVERIDKFERQCQETEYTSTDEAWELLNSIRDQLVESDVQCVHCGVMMNDKNGYDDDTCKSCYTKLTDDPRFLFESRRELVKDALSGYFAEKNRPRQETYEQVCELADVVFSALEVTPKVQDKPLNSGERFTITFADKPIEEKCGGCNWGETSKYKLDGMDDDEGLCATCMLETLLGRKLIVEMKCRNCGKTLIKSDNPGYAFQCMNCDEDFYSFEVV